MATKRGWKYYLGWTLAILFLIVIGLIAAITIPKNVKANWSENDYNSGMQKLLGIQSKMESNIIKSSNQPLELSLTSEEASGLLSKTDMISTITGGFMPEFNSVNVKFLGNNELEMLCTLKPSKGNFNTMQIITPEKKYTQYFMNAATKVPVYSKLKINNDSSKNFKITIEQINLGQVPIPNSMLKAAQLTVDNMTARYIRSNNINIEKFEITPNKMDYVGSIPKGIIKM